MLCCREAAESFSGANHTPTKRPLRSALAASNEPYAAERQTADRPGACHGFEPEPLVRGKAGPTGTVPPPSVRGVRKAHDLSSCFFKAPRTSATATAASAKSPLHTSKGNLDSVSRYVSAGSPPLHPACCLSLTFENCLELAGCNDGGDWPTCLTRRWASRPPRATI